MMREFKKLASLVLALVMSLAVAAPAFASGPELGEETEETPKVVTYDKVTITVPKNSEKHEYAVYQIFKGKPEKNETTGAVSDTSMTDIEWGDGIDDRAAFIADLQEQPELKDNKDIAGLTATSTAAQVAQAIFSATGGKDKSPEAKAVQKAASGHLTAGSSGKVMQGNKEGNIGQKFETGYYMIMDTDSTTTPATTSYTLLRVTGDAQIKIKSENVPDLDKEVKEHQYTETEDAGKWGNVATYPVDPDAEEGTPVDFRLVATLPDTYDPASEDAYKLVFHDKQDETFEFPSSIVVTAGGKTLEEGEYVLVTDPDDDCTFEISIADLKKLTNVDLKAGSEIVVSYTSVLKPGATVGGKGNKNTVKLEYGVNGESNPVITTVFTFKLTVNKFDGLTKEALVGAEFLLEKLEGKVGDEDNWVTVKNYGADNGKSEFEFAKLSAGRYRLTETKVVTPYNPLTKPIYFTVSYTTKTENEQLVIDEVKAVETNPDGSKLTGEATLTFTGDSAGELVTNVNNFSGVVLPETGGIGTTIFYIVGGILVVGAVVLLITKRRMGASEE